MKRIILGVIWLLLLTESSYASLIPFIVTGEVRRYEIGKWQDCSNPNIPCPLLYPESGESYAQRITLDDSYLVTDISGIFDRLYIEEDPWGGKGHDIASMEVWLMDNDFINVDGIQTPGGNKIYNKTWDINALDSMDTKGDNIYNDSLLNYHLKKGDYWFGVTTISNSRSWTRVSKATPGFIQGIVNPEPSTICLMGIGLIGAYFKNKKRTIYFSSNIRLRK